MNRAFSNTRNFIRRCPAVLVITLASLCLAVRGEAEPNAPAAPVYHIYAGNTHAHTSYTWSHGTQWPNSPFVPASPAAERPSDVYYTIRQAENQQ